MPSEGADGVVRREFGIVVEATAPAIAILVVAAVVVSLSNLPREAGLVAVIPASVWVIFTVLKRAAE